MRAHYVRVIVLGAEATKWLPHSIYPHVAYKTKMITPIERKNVEL